jgi:hypothetical protein
MAKNTSQAPATQAPEAEAPKVPTFLESLATLATPVTDLNSLSMKRDPVIGTRAKFAQNADEQVKLIKAAAETGKWFKRIGEAYVVAVRNGNSAMKLGENTHFKCADAAAACKFIESAKVAAQEGQLDEAFKASARAPKKAKAATPTT